MKDDNVAIVNFSDVMKDKNMRLDAEFYVKKKIKCSLCDQEFRKYDPHIAIRKRNHEQKHTRGWNCKGRQNGGGNNTIGRVRWIDLK